LARRSGEPRTLGRTGEEAAVRYLQEQGYRILERNFRCRFGEIDLIARDAGVLVFIEVKTRRSHTFGPPAMAVTAAKQRHLIKAAQLFLSRTGRHHEVCRFDVISVEMDGAEPHLEIIKNAFQQAGSL
jgi:putative endonuclease